MVGITCILLASLIGLLLLAVELNSSNIATSGSMAESPLANARPVGLIEAQEQAAGVAKFTSDPLVSFERGLELVRSSASFREAIIGAIARSPNDAVFFEMPAVSAATAASMPFAFVLVAAPTLASVRTDPHSFRDYLSPAPTDGHGGATGGAIGSTSVTFTSLGGDATLVVPRPSAAEAHSLDCYAHLAAFVRGAPSERVHDWLSLFASAALQRLAHSHGAPLWISTSGSGVSFLHGRLDERPKYYTYAPYAVPPAAPDSLLLAWPAVLIGEAEEEAAARIRALGLLVRIVARDGVRLPATKDYRTNRINLEVVDGWIVAAEVY